MRMLTSLLSAALVSLVAIMAGCSFTTAHFVEVTMARAVDANFKPLERTSTFHKSDPILHCSALIGNAPSETKVKAVWLFKPKEGPVQRVDSAEITVESKEWIDFTFRPANVGLPYGEYSVDLSIDGKFKQSVPFSVKPRFESGVVREAAIAAEVNASYYPTALASTFQPDVQAVYLPVYAAEAPLGTILSARWYQGSGSARTELVLTNFTIEEQGWSGWVGFSLKPTRPLPVGTYEADILINGETQTTLAFSVK